MKKCSIALNVFKAQFLQGSKYRSDDEITIYYILATAVKCHQ